MNPPHILIIDCLEARSDPEVKMRKPMGPEPNLDVIRQADVIQQPRCEVRQSFNLPLSA